jgi:hypothetical protein
MKVPPEKACSAKLTLEMRRVFFSTKVLDVARRDDVKRYLSLELPLYFLVVDKICGGRSGLRFIGKEEHLEYRSDSPGFKRSVLNLDLNQKGVVLSPDAYYIHALASKVWDDFREDIRGGGANCPWDFRILDRPFMYNKLMTPH